MKSKTVMYFVAGLAVFAALVIFVPGFNWHDRKNVSAAAASCVAGEGEVCPSARFLRQYDEWEKEKAILDDPAVANLTGLPLEKQQHEVVGLGIDMQGQFPNRNPLTGDSPYEFNPAKRKFTLKVIKPTAATAPVPPTPTPTPPAKK